MIFHDGADTIARTTAKGLCHRTVATGFPLIGFFLDFRFKFDPKSNSSDLDLSDSHLPPGLAPQFDRCQILINSETPSSWIALDPENTTGFDFWRLFRFLSLLDFLGFLDSRLRISRSNRSDWEEVRQVAHK